MLSSLGLPKWAERVARPLAITSEGDVSGENRMSCVVKNAEHNIKLVGGLEHFFCFPIYIGNSLEVASYSNLRGFFRIRMLAVLAYVSATLKPYVLDP